MAMPIWGYFIDNVYNDSQLKRYSDDEIRKNRFTDPQFYNECPITNTPEPSPTAEENKPFEWEEEEKILFLRDRKTFLDL